MDAKEAGYYSRPTAKLSEATLRAFKSRGRRHSASSSNYSIEDIEDDTAQRPLGVLTTTQARFISDMMSGLAGGRRIEVNRNCRAMYVLGSWFCKSEACMVTMCMAQPHLVNSMVQLREVKAERAEAWAREVFTDDEAKTCKTAAQWTKMMGRFSIPIADYFIESGKTSPDNIRWANVVMSQATLFFTIMTGGDVIECFLSVQSCKRMAKYSAGLCTINEPVSSNNSAIVRPLVGSDGATSGFISVHGSGMIQYQGPGDRAGPLCLNFRKCLSRIMASDSVSDFIGSLRVSRRINA